LGLDCKIGLMARPERVILLAAGLILGGSALLPWTMGLLAVTSTATAVQRILHVWRSLASEPSAQYAAPTQVAQPLAQTPPTQVTQVTAPARHERRDPREAPRAAPPSSQ
jgi:CDP-diacylglycerol--glycerol-3-phosphate 3-phosphatidyltransferase